MRRSLKKLKQYDLITKDKHKGSISDFLFDDKTWILRYVSGEFGTLFKEKKLLIPKAFFKTPKWTAQLFPVELTRSEIVKCPEFDENILVSRKYEEKINQFYEIEDYWHWSFYPPENERSNNSSPYRVPYPDGMTPPPVPHPPKRVDIPSKVVTEEDVNSRIRSYNEIIGYKVNCMDGNAGLIHDIIIDDLDWRIFYAVVDTSDSAELDKDVKILISTEYMEKISYADLELSINLHLDTLKAAPEFNSEEAFNEEFEKELFDYMESNIEEIGE